VKSLLAGFLIAITVIGFSLAGLTRFGLAQDSAAFKISGYILDANGQGIAGANIIFNVPDIVPSVISDSSGYYEIFAPAGTYHVNVWPPFDSNFMSYGESGFVVESDKTKNITLNSGYKVSGYITDSSGTPIVRAVVALDNFFCGWYSTYSGYYFVTAPAGTYTLTARPAKGPRDVTDFSPYYEYNVVVDGNIAKNISIGGSSPTPWPMFHKDPAHSGYTESTGPLTNQILWRYQAGSGIESSPAVVDDVVYFGALYNGYNGFVYALNAKTGSKIWQFATDSGVESSPAVVDGVVYVGGYDGYIYALNATTGSVFWESRTEGYIFSSPVVAGEALYVGSYDGNVYALNAGTGGKIWSYQTGGKMRSSCAVANGVAYVGSDDGYLYAFGYSSGQPASYKISGYILDANGHGIKGANVIFNVPSMFPASAQTLQAIIRFRLPQEHTMLTFGRPSIQITFTTTSPDS
jgi:outer membrane protein assembly factor BamB